MDWFGAAGLGLTVIAATGFKVSANIGHAPKTRNASNPATFTNTLLPPHRELPPSFPPVRIPGGATDASCAGHEPYARQCRTTTRRAEPGNLRHDSCRLGGPVAPVCPVSRGVSGSPLRGDMLVLS